MKEMFRETILKINDNLKALQALRESADNLADKIALDIAILCNNECHAHTMHQHYAAPTEEDIAKGMDSPIFPISEDDVIKEYAENAANSEKICKQTRCKLDMLSAYLDDENVSRSYEEYKANYPIPYNTYWI